MGRAEQTDAIAWRRRDHPNLPPAVRLFEGSRRKPKLRTYYLEINLRDTQIALRSVLVKRPAPVAVLTKRIGAIAAINGGFFGGSTSYSAVVDDGQLRAKNVGAVTRRGRSFPVARSLFYVGEKSLPSIDWIYHFGDTASDIYRFARPLRYSRDDASPRTTPTPPKGTPLGTTLVGIGGGPTLVRAGRVEITYDEEIFWGSGVPFDKRDPRTAIGYTADQRVILLVADGRQPEISLGLNLIELAEAMLQLGCRGAMNLDGGGSTQMATAEGYVNSPSESRAVPSLVALVASEHAD